MVGNSTRLVQAIDNESKLRALDRRLGTCEGDQWEPPLGGDMFNSRILVPEGVMPSDPSKIQELAYPKALLRAGPYECRALDDRYNTSITSDYIFNNATKQDRYKQMNKPTKPAAPSDTLKAAPEMLRPDLTWNAGSPDPANPSRSYEISARNQQQELVANAAPTQPVHSIDRVVPDYNSHFAPG